MEKAYAPGLLRMPIAEFIFYIALGMYVLADIMAGVNANSIFGLDKETLITLLQGISFFLLSFKILLFWFNKKITLLLTLSAAIVCVSAFQSRSYMLMWILLFGLSGFDTSIKRCSWLILLLSSFMLIAVVLLNIGGAIESELIIRNGVSDIMRNSFGFIHPNRMGKVLFSIVASYVIIKYESFSVIDAVFCLTVSIFDLLIVDSRTSGLTLLVLPIGIMVWKSLLVKATKIKACTIAVILLSSICIVIMAIYDAQSGFFTNINRILSGRLSYMHEYYVQYGIELFGQHISTLGQTLPLDPATFKTIILDNAYANLIIVYGVVPTMVLLYMIWRASVVSIRCGYECVACMLLLCLFAGLCETYMLDITTNISIILIFKYCIYYEESEENHVGELSRSGSRRNGCVHNIQPWSIYTGCH